MILRQPVVGYTHSTARRFSHYAFESEKMEIIHKGEGTLLDDSMPMLGAGLHGNAHDPHRLPIILAGRGESTLAAGRSLSCAKNTPIANLYAGMLHRLGTLVKKFAASTGALAELADAEFKGVAAPA